ncbi:MAG: quinone-dependent dihydroorotate dehydrogenase [Burkholderiaceae bacterium]|nr:quinone-dependent dihydroorotate dehydrogenase [Burkholderiaceae bacterium]
MPMDLYPFARPLLFAIDPERAHELTMGQIDRAAACGAMRLVAGAPVSDPVQVMGLRFANRVGLAAGLDKNGAHLAALQTMGFGFIEVGTVTPRAQPGNPRPRMFRLPERRALINRLGFNNEGVDAFLANIARSNYRGVLGLNIGKNADTPIERALDDYRLCLQRVYPHASYVTVNISSPNTKNLRQLQGGDDLQRMLEGLAQTREQLAVEHRRRVPMALKIAPDLDDAQIDTLAQALPRHGFDAVIATNTTLSRDAVAGLPHAEQAGGLSGAPVLAPSNRVIAALRARLPAGYPIIGVGGVMSGADARSKIDAGATVVQIYTGLVYRGPALVRECAVALARQAMRA